MSVNKAEAWTRAWVAGRAEATRALTAAMDEQAIAQSGVIGDLQARLDRAAAIKEHWARLVATGRVSANAFRAVYGEDPK